MAPRQTPADPAGDLIGRAAEPVPQVKLQGMAADGIGYGLMAGLAESGHGVENVEFNAGLYIALETVASARRWLDGENPFEVATEMAVDL